MNVHSRKSSEVTQRPTICNDLCTQKRVWPQTDCKSSIIGRKKAFKKVRIFVPTISKHHIELERPGVNIIKLCFLVLPYYGNFPSISVKFKYYKTFVKSWKQNFYLYFCIFHCYKTPYFCFTYIFFIFSYFSPSFCIFSPFFCILDYGNKKICFQFKKTDRMSVIWKYGVLSFWHLI